MKRSWAASMILTTAALTMFAGCSSSPNESERYLDAVSVDSYVKVASEYDNAAIGYFVGPALGDVKSVIDGPGNLRVEEGKGDLSNGEATLHVGTGIGLLDDSVECQVLVFRLLPTRDGRPLTGAAHLSREQQAGVGDGSLHHLRISALCEPQADR